MQALEVADPYVAFVRVLSLFDTRTPAAVASGIHQSAFIHPDASLKASAVVLPKLALHHVLRDEVVGAGRDMKEPVHALPSERRLDGRERHQGVMTAIAVESLVKLVAFLAVAALAVVYLLRLQTREGAQSARVMLLK